MIRQNPEHRNRATLFEINRSVRQGDALSTLLFNPLLHAAISKVKAMGNIITKSRELGAYVYDIFIIGRNEKAIKETFRELGNKTKKAGLAINSKKTKYMITSRKQAVKINVLQIENYSFKRVANFTYL